MKLARARVRYLSHPTAHALNFVFALILKYQSRSRLKFAVAQQTFPPFGNMVMDQLLTVCDGWTDGRTDGRTVIQSYGNIEEEIPVLHLQSYKFSNLMSQSLTLTSVAV